MIKKDERKKSIWKQWQSSKSRNVVEKGTDEQIFYIFIDRKILSEENKKKNVKIREKNCKKKSKNKKNNYAIPQPGILEYINM